MYRNLWLGECPEPGCSLPCELVRVDTYDSTDGPVQTRRTRCLAGHVRDSHPVPAPLGRQMDCPSCGCEAHSPFVCGNDLGDGVRCPCHRVPTPGVHPDDDTDCSTGRPEEGT